MMIFHYFQIYINNNPFKLDHHNIKEDQKRMYEF